MRKVVINLVLVGYLTVLSHVSFEHSDIVCEDVSSIESGGSACHNHWHNEADHDQHCEFHGGRPDNHCHGMHQHYSDTIPNKDLSGWKAQVVLVALHTVDVPVEPADNSRYLFAGEFRGNNISSVPRYLCAQSFLI